MPEMLQEPSRELAAKVTREVRWDERIEGHMFDPGPGEMLLQLYKLQEVYRLLNGAANFRIDFSELQSWIKSTLGDWELAERISMISPDDLERRDKIINLLGTRLSQCERVLS